MSAKYLTGVVDPLNIIPIQNLYSALKIISNPNLQNEIKDRSEGLLFNKCKWLVFQITFNLLFLKNKLNFKKKTKKY